MLDKCKDVCRIYDAIQYVYAEILSDGSDIVEFRCNVFLEGLEGGDVEYFAGIKLFNKVIDRLGFDMDQQKWYEVFDHIYEEGMRGKKVERNKDSR